MFLIGLVQEEFMSVAIPVRGGVRIRLSSRVRRVLRYAVAGAAIFVVCFAMGWAAWAGVAWIRYGHAVAVPPEDPLMNRFMPRYEVIEQHERVVEAPPLLAFDAVSSFRLEDSPIIRSIFRAREIIFAQESAETSSSPPFLELARQIGWGLLDSVPGREVVFGAVTQPWRGDVRFRSLAPERFATFDSAGYAKIVWSMAIDSLGPARSRVRTETRVETTDPMSRARFRRYWSIYSPGIVLIRRESLRLIGDKAERRFEQTTLLALVSEQ
jgi:hypothetical protein